MTLTNTVCMDRVILHSDLNSFYASVEMARAPHLKGRAVVVCGEKEDRHGIVLAKSELAKKHGVKTGDVLWEARQKCPNLVEITADFPLYVDYSRKVRKIYECYTDQIESFGIDECWLDVTGSVKMFGSGEQIAEAIRQRVKEELDLTVSIGVSFNKIFAKLGSDLKKPDAITVITRENYKDIVWCLPCEELLYVGKATKSKLNRAEIWTIGDIATASLPWLQSKLDKWGVNLYYFANGLDQTPVMKCVEERAVKSIGNSLTHYKDMTTDDEVKTLVYLLSESVAARLRESGLFKGNVVHLFLRDSKLKNYGKQKKLAHPTRLSSDIARTAYALYKEMFPTPVPLRAIGVTISQFIAEDEQLYFDYPQVARAEQLEDAVERVRKKHGNAKIQRGIIAKDERLAQSDIKNEHVIHPENYF